MHGTQDTQAVTVVGGGLTGLIAAIEVAERGAPVRLLEARSRLGGRARTLSDPYLANLGPHALYAGGALWGWLTARRLEQPCRRPRSMNIRFHSQGEVHRTPPAALLRARRLRGQEPPIDRTFRSWTSELCGDEAAAALCGAAGVLTFDHDPGRLSAAFVWERYQRILLRPIPVARYVVGGWGAMIDRLAAHATERGVTIECRAKVDAVDDLRGPVIVAVEPGAARRLLGDDALQPEAPRVALLDVALLARRGDPYVVSDLDSCAFVDRFTSVDRTLAPEGESLVQVHMGMRPDEDLDTAIARIHAILDRSFEGWRSRLTWQRRAVVKESTGAVDLPGTTWRDRSPITYADGVWLAGDWVAAPGHLAEVSCTSAVQAAEAATTRAADPAGSGTAARSRAPRPRRAAAR
jgi:phytoene dehydrogenase-like protein